ncbi:substrate-binding periplasmic protein [Vreelandella utahensis]|uniref:substrate-binding periplasmic protein n=1 Tax=Vreelandella halophila TaxID=86177 RepID=UPI001C4DE18D|nr:transporter substrate-binding domain-containing protein [Halomonas utahensis]
MVWLRTVLLALTMMVPALALAGETTEDRTVSITNGEWPPYLGREEPGYGIASRIVSRAFERAGYQVEYEFHPWARSLYLARRGERDGTAVWVPSSERREDFFISRPVIVTEYVFFHRADMPFDWETTTDLADYRIGLTRGYDYGEVLDRVRTLGVATTETVSSDELNFHKLLAGRIDLFPLDRVVGQRMISELFSEEEAKALTWHPEPVREDRLHLLLSREVEGNAKRIEDFNRALKAMRREGGIEKILVEALGNEMPAVDRLTPAQAD